jgi:3D (Asp-Asp-Asp) domain-containing protein
MVLSRSLWRKLLVTAVAAIAFVLIYETVGIDFRVLHLTGGSAPPLPKSAIPKTALPAGTRANFVATAYCKGETTAAGVPPQAGIAAADPDLLPVGSVVHIDDGLEAYRGIYTVLDTGPKVQGPHVDLYIWSCFEALAFGKRDVTLTVLRLGWNPKNTAPGIK